MKNVVRILILAEFLAIIFVPGIYTHRILLLPLFISMAGLVALYWFAMFWVSRKDAGRVLGVMPEHDLYVGKIPSDTRDDLTRGRLCAVGDRLVLLQRTDDKEHRKTPCREAWSVPISEITSAGFGKVLSARNGFILYLGDDEIRFTSAKAAKNKKLLYDILGWEVKD